MENVQIALASFIACICGYIGTGSVGPVIAVSEDNYQNVPLLEAGGRETNFTEISATILTMEYNWSYYSTPQNTLCLGMHEKLSACSRGKILGGTFGVDALNRTNRKILTHSYVTRAFITSKTKRAVVWTGSIGPKLHFQILGISVLGNLDVGKNFRDHVDGALHMEFNTSICIYLNDVGDLVGAFFVLTLTFMQTHLAKVDDFPDIELLQSLSASDYSTYKLFFNYDVISYEPAWAKVDFNKTFTMYVVIELKSTDPFEYPLIDSKVLCDSVDFDTMYEFVLQLLISTLLKAVNARQFNVHLPACQHVKYVSKHCQTKHLSSSFFHPIGTCKMGPNPMDGAVVDDKVRMHGIQNLSLAEASIVTILPGQKKYKNFKQVD